MSHRIRKLLYWIGILLGGIFFLFQSWYGFIGLKYGALAAKFLLGFALGAVCVIGAMGLQISAWRFMMRNLNVSLSWNEVLESLVISFLPRYIPGSVWGYLSRAEWLKQSKQIPYSISNFSSILEIGFIVIGVVIISGIYILKTQVGVVWWIISSICFGFPVISWLVYRLGMIVLRKSNFNTSFQEILLVKFRLGSWLCICLIHALAWLSYGGALFWLLRFVIDNPPGNSLATSSFIFAFSWLLGFFALFVPSGLGIREQSIVTLLVSKILLSTNVAALVAVSSRVLMSFGELFWIFTGVVIRRSKKRKSS